MNKLAWLGIICIFAVVVSFLPGCSHLSFVNGKGNVVDKQYQFSDFTEIDVSSNLEIVVAPLNIYTVVITGYENLFDYLDISQSGKTLKIGLKPFISYRNQNMKATVTLPVLGGLTLSGASHGTAKGFKSDQDFILTESGSGFLDMDMETGTSTLKLSGESQVMGMLKSTNARMELSGASHVNLNGNADNIVLNSSGAGTANLMNFALQNAGVTLSGTSQATLTLNGKLDADLSGTSLLDYAGNPSLGKINITGGSQLNHQQS